MSERKNPVDRAVDLVVYAPIGLVAEARRLLPSFVDKGRAQVDMYKLIGRFTVLHGQQTAKKQLARSQEQVDTLLGEFGLRPAGGPATTEPPPASSTSSTPEAVTEQEVVEPPEAVAAPRSGPSSVDLPVADYDSLAASQVIPRLAGLDADELEAVRAYEAAHRGRKTILGRLAQLQGA